MNSEGNTRCNVESWVSGMTKPQTLGKTEARDAFTSDQKFQQGDFLSKVIHLAQSSYHVPIHFYTNFVANQTHWNA